MISFIPHAYAAASSAEHAAQCFVNKINDAILFPLITLMMALAFLFFLYGAFEYVKNAGNDSAREIGRQHLFYGVIGMLVMLSAFAILNVAAGTFKLTIFNADSIACDDSPAAQTSLGDSSFGSGFVAPSTAGASIPSPSSDSRAPSQPAVPVLDTAGGPDAGFVPDTTVSCPPNTIRTAGRCEFVSLEEYPVLGTRSTGEIEVSCGTDSSCGGAIQACNTYYSGEFTVANPVDQYVVCRVYGNQ